MLNLKYCVVLRGWVVEEESCRGWIGDARRWTTHDFCHQPRTLVNHLWQERMQFAHILLTSSAAEVRVTSTIADAGNYLDDEVGINDHDSADAATMLIEWYT